MDRVHAHPPDRKDVEGLAPHCAKVFGPELSRGGHGHALKLDIVLTSQLSIHLRPDSADDPLLLDEEAVSSSDQANDGKRVD